MLTNTFIILNFCTSHGAPVDSIVVPFHNTPTTTFHCISFLLLLVQRQRFVCSMTVVIITIIINNIISFRLQISQLVFFKFIIFISVFFPFKFHLNICYFVLKFSLDNIHQNTLKYFKYSTVQLKYNYLKIIIFSIPL